MKLPLLNSCKSWDHLFIWEPREPIAQTTEPYYTLLYALSDPKVRLEYLLTHVHGRQQCFNVLQIQHSSSVKG